jgi:hypothetical protein
MSRDVFNWVSHLIRTKPDQSTSRAWSETGHLVVERYHCGRIQNDKLIFTAQDKFQLRRQLKKEFGLAPFLTKQLPDDRMDIAKHHDNEKLARLAPSHDHIIVNSPDGTLQLNKQRIYLHTEQIPSAGMMCLGSSINQIDHESIVVVENLPIMQLCNSFTLPPLCQKALWVYRGDHKSGAKAKACYDLLKRFGQDKKVIVFSDMDPKGLEIALTLPYASYWLGPETKAWTGCLQSRHASLSGYDVQTRAMKYLLNKSDAGSLSKPINDLVLQMRTEHSSYRQEHMFAHNIPLALFPLFQRGR